MTPIRILSFLLLLVGINVSGQRPLSLPFSSLPMGENRYPADMTIELGVYSLDSNTLLTGDFIPYHAASETALLSFLQEKLHGFASSGNDNVWLSIVAGVGGTYDNQSLTLVNGKLPALDFQLKYGGGGFVLKTATNFELETSDRKMFSTVTGQNDFVEHGCDMLGARRALEAGNVTYQAPINSRENPVKRLTIWEGTKFVSVNGDGIPTEWSMPAPSFFKAPEPPPPATPERRPLMVNIRLEGRLPILVVSGDGAETAVIEQSRNSIGNWGPAISLSSPPRLSSVNGGGYVYEFARDPEQSGDVSIFYRAR